MWLVFSFTFLKKNIGLNIIFILVFIMPYFNSIPCLWNPSVLIQALCTRQSWCCPLPLMSGHNLIFSLFFLSSGLIWLSLGVLVALSVLTTISIILSFNGLEIKSETEAIKSTLQGLDLGAVPEPGSAPHTVHCCHFLYHIWTGSGANTGNLPGCQPALENIQNEQLPVWHITGCQMEGDYGTLHHLSTHPSIRQSRKREGVTHTNRQPLRQSDRDIHFLWNSYIVKVKWIVMHCVIIEYFTEGSCVARVLNNSL